MPTHICPRCTCGYAEIKAEPGENIPPVRDLSSQIIRDAGLDLGKILGANGISVITSDDIEDDGDIKVQGPEFLCKSVIRTIQSIVRENPQYLGSNTALNWY